MHSGYLAESTPQHGNTLTRTDGSPMEGVYLHGDDNRQKTASYASWVSPCEDGLYWRCVVEVAAAERAQVFPGPGKKTDQLSFRSYGVIIIAIHIEVRPLAKLSLFSQRNHCTQHTHVMKI